MLRNIITIALRNFLRQKGFSILNTIGLSIGLAVSMLILIKVSFELKYDRFHKDYDNIYRIVSDINNGGQEIKVSMSPAILSAELKKAYPEITDFARIYINRETLPIKLDEAVFDKANVIYTDSTFFHFFSFKLLEGDPLQILKVSDVVVISSSWAKKLFGDKSAIGQRIKIGADKFKVITGVFQDCPKNSTIKADLILSISDYPSQGDLADWLNFEFDNYIKLQPNTKPERINEYIPTLVAKNVKVEEYKTAGFIFKFLLQPLSKIHLYSDRLGENEAGIGYIFLYLSISIIVLLLAIINFTNLTTAKSMIRAKEVAIRKVVGSKRKLLIFQFMGESILLSILAYIIGLLLVELLLPWFGTITGSSLSFNLFTDFNLTLIFLALAIVTGIFSGLYPALVLSKFAPTLVFKNFSSKGKSSKVLRNGLIIFQFTATVSLIICTLTIYNQLNFIQSKKLGFDRENIIVVPLNNLAKNIDPKTLKIEMERIPDVINTSLSQSTPVTSLSARDFQVGGEPADKPLILPYCVADFDFGKTIGLKITQGRGFSKEFPSDADALMINEAFVKRFGWKDPLSMTITYSGITHKIIGVVNDFNFEDLKQTVKPMVIIPKNDSKNYLLLKIQPGDPKEALKKVNSVWKRLGNEYDPNTTFINDMVNSMYTNEKTLAQGFLFLTIIAIVIACLGLIGLAAYISESRAKEVGIRKVMGGTPTQIVYSLSKIFLGLIAVANLVAIPISIYAMNKWLSNFAFRTSLSFGLIAIAVLSSFIIAILSISALTVKTALKNPVDSLKYE